MDHVLLPTNFTRWEGTALIVSNEAGEPHRCRAVEVSGRIQPLTVN